MASESVLASGPPQPGMANVVQWPAAQLPANMTHIPGSILAHMPQWPTGQPPASIAQWPVQPCQLPVADVLHWACWCDAGIFKRCSVAWSALSDSGCESDAWGLLVW